MAPTSRSSVWFRSLAVATTVAALGLKGTWIGFSLDAAVVTKPMSVRDLLQAYAIGMPQFLTPITVHQHIFVIVFLANLACLGLEVLVRYFQEHRWVKVGDLGFVLYRVGGDNITC